MSVNRSVQAAQRRRTGPADTGVPGRGPQPSINSAQMFANQARPGNGPNIPTGRLAGQYANGHIQQQQQQYKQSQQKEGLSSVSKMTIPQAITLITLRLGAIESKLIHMPEIGTESVNVGDLELNDSSNSIVLQSILTRLESLEKRSVTSTTPEVNLIKQQVDILKQAAVQNKGISNNIVKENTNLKNQIEKMQKELIETKELLDVLQNITMDNSQKILEFSINNENGQFNGFSDLNDLNILTNELQNDNELQNNDELLDDNELQNDDLQEEIIGNDLKQLIENELNTYPPLLT
jgi:hypothetical protein